MWLAVTAGATLAPANGKADTGRRFDNAWLHIEARITAIDAGLALAVLKPSGHP